MSTVSLRLRGLAALIVLVLFPLFVTALIILIVMIGWATVKISSTAGAHILVLVVPLMVAVGASVRDIMKARKPEPLPGHELPRHDHPALWAELDSLAAAMDQPQPDRVVVLPTVNAFVTTAAGRREVMIGYPLLAGLTRVQLRSVLAHEMGHLAHGHTRSSRLAYRAGGLLKHTVSRLDGGIVRFLIVGYHRLYLLIAMSVLRDHERQADDWSARLIGGQEAASTFPMVARLDRVWEMLTEVYLPLAVQVQARPPLCQAIYELSEANQAELDRFVAAAIAREPSHWDTHPADAERMRRLEATPAQTTAAAGPPEAAWHLLGRQIPRRTGALDPDIAGAALLRIEAELFLEQLTPATWAQVVHEATVQEVRQSLGFFLDQFAIQYPGRPANLRTVLPVLASGSQGAAGVLVAPLLSGALTPQQRAAAIESQIGVAARAATLITLTDQGRAWAAVSWDSLLGWRYREPAGQAVEWPVELVPELPLSHSQAVRMLDRLVRDGVDIDAPLSVDPSSRRLRAVAEGAVAAVKLRPRRPGLNRQAMHDVLVMDDGLLITPVTGQRYAFAASFQTKYMPGALRNKTSERIRALVQKVDGDPQSWVQDPAHDALWLPYPSITAAAWATGMRSWNGRRLTLRTADGAALVVGWTSYSVEVGDVDSVLAAALHGRL
jgi:Zn-dependent protease with chaperone function